jgi:hypothetical protein
MKKVVPCLGFAAILLCGQQPAPPRTIPYTLAELEAIPVIPARTGTTVKKALFDGKTLDGWQGNPDWWSVRDGAIVGKFNDKVPTSFLFTKDNYSDFRLTLSSKVVESENHAGVCFWGEIAEKGENKWYTHGPLVIFPNPSMWDYNDGKGLRVYKPTLEKVTSQHEWVQVEFWQWETGYGRRSMALKFWSGGKRIAAASRKVRLPFNSTPGPDRRRSCTRILWWKHSRNWIG